MKTIESVIDLTCTGYEYIIIDGGSTDGSREIIEYYASRLSFWVSEPDKGIYHAMNKGIEKAKGEYLLFLNSGDFIVDRNVLEKINQANITEDIVVGDCNVSENGKVIFHATPPDEISLAAFYGGTIPHQSAFIKREMFQKIGYYSENYRIHSDLEFFIKALIIEKCSYRHLSITVSDYNTEGISGKGSGRTESEEKEYDEILNQLIPSSILKDYATWKYLQDEWKILNWVQSKPLLYRPLVLIFRIAEWYVSFRRNKMNLHSC